MSNKQDTKAKDHLIQHPVSLVFASIWFNFARNMITRIVWQHFPTRNKTLRHLALDSNRRERQPPRIKVQNAHSRSNKKYNVINRRLDTVKNKHKQSTSKITKHSQSIFFPICTAPKSKWNFCLACNGLGGLADWCFTASQVSTEGNNADVHSCLQ